MSCDQSKPEQPALRNAPGSDRASHWLPAISQPCHATRTAACEEACLEQQRRRCSSPAEWPSRLPMYNITLETMTAC